MRLIIEEYQYPADKVGHILDGISNLRDVNGLISVNYVGYFYNPTLRDCVFILPKVLLEPKDNRELVFGKYLPEDIVNLESQKLLTPEEHSFIYELAVWIYRAIVVYRDDATDNTIIKQQFAQEMGKGRVSKCNTFLDILLALQKFNRDNQDFFFFVLRNQHSGFNKINWNRTISHTTAFIQDRNPIYINPVNKKKRINFDEELLIIFFSILRYMNAEYGFPVTLNMNFPLITGIQFEAYRNGMGKRRLMQIKYKYFSDKALYLWELCYAFFDQSKKINIEANEKEYLLAKNFNIVFEAIIDKLIGDPDIPDALKNQGDGKRVDHMYQYRNLTNNEEDKEIYYIGDSKYYKRNTPIGTESVYKQFTYARNVIQWNIDLFSEGAEEDKQGHFKLRDDDTEGYNIIPNFFISAHQNTLSREETIQLTSKDAKYFQSRQFENRLFDRDSFLIAHYDVNFLFVVALYGRNNKGEMHGWRDRVRQMFRTEIQKMLEEKFDFYAFTPKEGVSAIGYIQDHFQQLLGKVFTPYEDRGTQKYYSLALDNRPEYTDDNAAIVEQLKSSFYIEPCKIGQDPKILLPEVAPITKGMAATPDFLTMHYLEKYLDKNILIGCYHDEAHLKWILGHNDKGTLLYNVRIGKDREGGMVENQLLNKAVSFVVLYKQEEEHKNEYRVFRVHHHATMTAKRIKEAWYPSEPKSKKYFCYVFDEEVTLGSLDISKIVSAERISNHDYVDGAPIYVTGEELITYRM